MKIADREIGPDKPLYIIAEMGLAHLGSFDLALQMTQQAAAAGATAIKTQWWDVKRSATLYSGPRKPSRCLSQAALEELKRTAETLGLHFLCTPHDTHALEWVIENCPTVKIGSGERGRLDLIVRAFESHKPVLISIGGYSYDQYESLFVLRNRYSNCPHEILQCVSDYPTTVEADLPNGDSASGWSSHTAYNWDIDAYYVSRGAYILEKHIKPTGLQNIEDSMDMRASIQALDLANWIKRMQKFARLRGVA